MSSWYGRIGESGHWTPGNTHIFRPIFIFETNGRTKAYAQDFSQIEKRPRFESLVCFRIVGPPLELVGHAN